MNKIIVAIVSILVFFLGQIVWAASSNEEKERLEKAQKQIEEMKKQQQQWMNQRQTPMHSNRPLSRGMVGRYQAIKLDDGRVFILDTAEGDFWIWKMNSGQPAQHQGQISQEKK
jgi:lipopolysaccharide export LptBFGC system permease protein LptF